MRRAPFSRFLARSLALLADELPEYHRLVATRIGRREVLLHVDGEDITVQSFPPRLTLTLKSHAPDVELWTKRAAISRLINGEDTLVDAILGDRVVLRGTVDDLIAFHDGLMAYLHGAVRCPAFAELRDEYLAEPRAPRPKSNWEGIRYE